MSFIKYPIVFKPILKNRIWGGTKLKTCLGKQIESEGVGESWELSGVDNDVSVVANGAYSGMDLDQLLAKYPQEILGKRIFDRFKYQFPLLFKFLDAKEDLSIQLHPSNELALERHQSFGKTEMWYVMKADPGSRVVVDFKEGVKEEDYLHHLKEKTLPSILNEIEVKQGDVFFIKTGTVHAIGKGVLLAEIQQTSDITYRVYDWDRVDANGKSRELHVDMALEAINYNKKESVISYPKAINSDNEVVTCPYFTVNYIPLNGTFVKQNNMDCFVVYVCADGECMFTIEGHAYRYKKGDTILVPASVETIKIEGEATLLEIFVP